MKSLFKKFVKELFSLMGFKITRTGTGILSGRRKFALLEKNRFKWIQDMNIKTVIDIGAHTGQSALQFHELFPASKIYSFEPLHDCFMQMNGRLKNVPNFKSFNLALGDKEGKLEIHRSEWSQSSSLRKMGNLHKKAFPFSSGESVQTVDVSTLDKVVQELDLEDNILLKIDVQGYEDKVIMGSQDTLKRVKVVIVETSFRELYEDQPLFSDVYELLCKQGFVYSGSWSESNNPLDGAPLQQDSIFIKRWGAYL